MAWYRIGKKQKHSGAMIALHMPNSVARCIKVKQSEVPEGSNLEDPSEYHVTLLYLGEAKDNKKQKKKIIEVLEYFAKIHKPLIGKVSGVGCFNVEGDGKRALYASFDCPDLPAFRQDLIEELKKAGVEFDENHGFTPHITLAYIPQDCDTQLVDVPMVDARIAKITLAWAGDWTDYELKS